MNIAIDIGGTNTRISFFEDGSRISRETVKFDTITIAKENFDKIIKTINTKSADKRINGIGISAPGPTDYIEGVFGNLPNLPKWKGFEFLNYLKNSFGIDNIKAQNDANLMALANHHHFNKTSKDITQFFTVSTGLGGGLIINDEIFTGSNGYAQEIAMAPLAFSKENGKGLGEGALELFSAGSGLHERGKGFVNSTKELFETYESDPRSMKIIDEGIDTLANAIASIGAFINPSCIVFDGSVTRFNPWYIDKAIELAKTRMFIGQYEKIDFKKSELGDDSALLGALFLITK